MTANMSDNFVLIPYSSFHLSELYRLHNLELEYGVICLLPISFNDTIEPQWCL